MTKFIKQYKSLIIIAAIFAAVTALINMFIGLEEIAAISESLRGRADIMPFLIGSLFVLTYVSVAASSVPAASILTLAAGAIFGVFEGTLFVIIGATLGSAIPFLLVKYKFAAAIKRRYPAVTEKMLAGIENSEFAYLLSVRLAPIFPFYIVNAVSGVMNIKLRTFLLATAIGIAPGTTAYVFAGSQIERAIETGSLVSLEILLGLAALSIVSFVSTALSRRLRLMPKPVPVPVPVSDMPKRIPRSRPTR